jgi:general secretion pathway protein L
MSLLRIHIPSHWPDVEPAAPLPWCRLGARGECLASGSATLASLPRAETCELIIPADWVLLTRAALPRGNRQKMRQMLSYAIEDKLIAEPDSVHVATGATFADDQTALAVIDRTLLGRVLSRLSDAGLRPRHAWPETLLPELPDDGWVMVWDGRSGFLRTGSQSGMSLDGGSSAQPPVALALSVAQAREASELPHRLLLRLHENTPTPDVEAWRHALGMTVEVGMEWSPLHHPDLPVAGIDLLQGEFTSSGLLRDGWSRLRLPLILAGLIAVLQVGATTVEWFLLSHEKRQLQTAMEKSFREAFPDARVVVDAPLQMERKLAELRGAAGQLAPLDFLPLLARTATALDASQRSNLRAVHYEANQLSLEVALPDQAAADGVLKRLLDAGLVSQLQHLEGDGAQPMVRIVVTGNTP